ISIGMSRHGVQAADVLICGGASLDLEREAFARGGRRRKNPPGLEFNRRKIAVRSPWFVVEKPEMTGSAGRRKLRHLTPAGVTPAAMPGQFLGRKVRVGDQRRCVLAKRCKAFVDGRVSKLVVGRVDDVALITADAIRKCPARMVQR